MTYDSTWVKKMKKNLYLELFLSTLYLSTFTFGGGYVIVSMMKQKFCDELHYIDEQEMLDLVAIAQSAPGAIAVNGAIVLGYKMAGIKGGSCLYIRHNNSTFYYHFYYFFIL